MKLTVYKKEDKLFVDTNFINRSSGRIVNGELKHMGFGEFYIKCPKGTIQFARQSTKFGGMSGRNHRMYDDCGGALVDSLLKNMEVEIKDVCGEILTKKIGDEYIQLYKYGEDDFSIWITADLNCDDCGTSHRGTYLELFNDWQEVLHEIAPNFKG